MEYKLNGITQISYTADSGLTFQEVLRSFVRQKTDIIIVGEIRDMETADMAVKSVSGSAARKAFQFLGVVFLGIKIEFQLGFGARAGSDNIPHINAFQKIC